MKLVEANDSNTGEIQTILKCAPQYFLNSEGVPFLEDAAVNLLTEIPTNISKSQKKVFLIYKEDQIIGVCDFLIGYPDIDTGFLGLLLLKENNQKQGLGRKAFYEIKKLAQSFQLKKIQLAVIDSNPVSGFWKKMGFYKIERTKVHEGKHIKSIARVYELKLFT